MKKTISVLAAILLVFGLAACGNKEGQEAKDDAPTTQSGSAREEEKAKDSGDQSGTPDPASDTPEAAEDDASSAEAGRTEQDGGTLVVYFSATGTTKGVAEKIAAITGADLYEIKAEQEYSDADLNWNDSGSRTTKEQNDESARPAIGSDAVSLDGYTTIYIGYPIWWGIEPRIMDTFVESYSFDGITMIPFCTSGSSGIGRSGRNLADNAGSGNWLDGKRFGAGASEDDVRSWIESLQ
ncbi:MAG: flavodoxin [Lachnospiraceae bacterium]|nr:flavodoxin [Lachnospiraceae bacterium]